ncbi:MAG: GNAT family N-acetyltransferase [Lachnospiraceae bacterium]|jgi:ribosomal-protein-alanine N-acetyltransferase
MTKTCNVEMSGQLYKVCISDEPEALLAAKAAGRAVLGVGERCASSCPWITTFLRSWEDAGEKELDTIAERLVRREKKLPWKICETKRLLIREASAGDFEALLPFQNELTEGISEEKNIQAFETREALESYVSCQYGFFEYGLWVLEEKKSGRLVGAAGVWNPDDSVCRMLKSAGENPEEYLEMGYQIFSPYQRRGLAKEACQAVMAYTDWELECKVCLQVSPDNLPSLRLAESLGFWRLTPHINNGEIQRPYLYGWSC